MVSLHDDTLANRDVRITVTTQRRSMISVVDQRRFYRATHTQRIYNAYRPHSAVYNGASNGRVAGVWNSLPQLLLIFPHWHMYDVEADKKLFDNIRYNPSHPLHHLLSRRTDYSYNLRSRSHNLELSHTHDKWNFIDRMLFNPYHIC